MYEFADFDSTQSGQFPVEHDDVRAYFEHRLEGLLSVGYARNLEPFRLEASTHDPAEVVVVFDDEDRGHEVGLLLKG